MQPSRPQLAIDLPEVRSEHELQDGHGVCDQSSILRAGHNQQPVAGCEPQYPPSRRGQAQMTLAGDRMRPRSIGSHNDAADAWPDCDGLSGGPTEYTER
ncbi:hypothetical protein GCM10010170_042530 [Dactylosporangium salmoneum]|uniref:Uncharacterized protein n=1 Tax=Dactylosporangium salmoneum TaxID=53361 RepID=A0ABN3GIF8_9ACTN